MKSSEWGPCEGISALTRWDTKELSLPQLALAHTPRQDYVRTQQEGSCRLQARTVSTRTQPCGYPDPWLPAFRTVRKQIACLSHSVCRIFLWQPEQTKADWKREQLATRNTSKETIDMTSSEVTNYRDGSRNAEVINYLWKKNKLLYLVPRFLEVIFMNSCYPSPRSFILLFHL